MKKRGLAAALAMLTMATTGTAFAATSYWIPVYYNNEGYNSTPVKKVIPADHAYVKALGSNHNELPTNYIVIANNSAQMTQGSINFMNSDRSKHSIPYKAAYYNYVDYCMLRANSGSPTANYTVWGEWIPPGVEDHRKA